MPSIQDASTRLADAVILDIGETVLDRTREYAAWARFFGVPAHTFSAVFGAMIARGSKVAQVIESFAPGTPYVELLEARRAAGLDVGIEEADLYSDVREALAELEASGTVVGIAGNQPALTSERLQALDLGAAFIASSTDWGVAKPSAEFFVRAAGEAGARPERTVYVGDQIRNDVLAPQAAGLATVRIRRGPWGFIEHDADAESGCLAVVDSLLELPAVLTA
ncbi:MAG TPA: HAD family hydrolase [Humibacter sp.]|nr:HAD family hydrolase [Humibacter sp.]